jgi:protein phosphatase
MGHNSHVPAEDSTVPVQVRCPHCSTLSLVSDEHLGVPVMCGTCKRSFWVRSPLAAPAAAGPEPPALKAGPPPAPPAPAATRFDVGGATSAGRVRKQNEDSFLAQLLAWSGQRRRGEAVLVVVADGLGGHEAGEEASNMAVRIIGGALLPLLTSEALGYGEGLTPKAVTDAVESALQDANREIHNKAKQEARRKGMGATAAVVVVRDGEARVGHVGDARVYHQRGDRLTQLTKDQTLAARMVELGQLSPKEALVHPARNDVYQAIGHRPDIKPAHYELRLAPGDWLIVASDGLHAHVGAEELQLLVAKAEPAAAKLAAALVDLTNDKGGTDNCTVVAVRCR